MRQYIHIIAPLLALAGFAGSLQAAPDTSPWYPADGANYAKFSNENPPLVPMPQTIKWADKSTTLSIISLTQPLIEGRDAAQMQLIHDSLVAYLAQHDVKVEEKGDFSIEFKLADTPLPEGEQDAWRQAEAYTITSTDKGLTVTASSTKGFYYAYQTIKQLIVRRGGQTTIACCDILDYPDLQIRGFMNDVGRNFMPIELIKEEIESMTDLKYNVYHFHMTDNHGWRLESKLYPELKDPKNFTRFEGKVYTQEEYQEFVEYCRLRNIMVIPELDMPGHTEAFRAAMGLDKMQDPKATEALVNLIKELGTLTSVEDTPYIHIGTDEAKRHEHVNNETLECYYEAVESTGRRPINWIRGMCPPSFRGKSVEHLWLGVALADVRPSNGSDYIDSQDSYVNHIDPFECGPAYYYRRPCPYTNANGLGFILCSWPDVKISDPRNHLSQTPVFTALAFCAQAVWNSPQPVWTGKDTANDLIQYYSNLPAQDNPLLAGFAEYEDRVVAIRDRFFTDKEFPYVRQSHVSWKLLGPIPHGGNVAKDFAIDADVTAGNAVKESYSVDGVDYSWSESNYTGHTLTFKQYCGYPTPFNGNKFGFSDANSTYYALQYIYSPEDQEVPFWISAQHWPSSDRAAGGPPSTPNEWHHSKPKFYVNGQAIAAPKWANKPLTGVEDPYTDENYFYRAPTVIALKKGWNQVLIKSPCNKSPRRWMFTFAPVQTTTDKFGIGIREFPGLKFATSIPDGEK